MASDFYQTDRAVAEYLLLHYGSAKQVLPYSFGPHDALGFPVRCITECLEPERLPPGARALEIGCAVGRSTFELVRYCAQAVGIDRSPPFIATARYLQQHGSINFACPEEGTLTVPATAFVPADLDRNLAIFVEADAEELPGELGGFDVVLMANLIDRLRDPMRCLGRLPHLVKAGGQLIITSPYTWLEEYTPMDHWLGGYQLDGKRVTTLGTL
ncbi:MAG: putative 4-mercaptohistidine N1-methyltransferase, partial [Candidatus Omnitrophica bacterium]|nr:putative 4-mercaptohistidine N1-methyltransferase [Candidatus Omnitrophota bacterium]